MENNFRFKCYKNLKTTLGEIDAIVESIELATREFISTVSPDISTSKETIQKNITELSEKHVIKVNYVDIKKLESRVMILHIINVYERFEKYLEELIEEHPDLGDKKSKQQEETILDYILRKLNKGSLKSTLDYSIINHYRLVRNIFVHSSDKKITKYENKIADTIKNSDYKILKAPNNITTLVFDDFILFTRAIKNFAKSINQHCQLSDEQMVMAIKENYKAKLAKLSNNIKRKECLITQLLKIDYNILDAKLVEQVLKD
ncbi:hypothetical protein [Sulfurimonas sp.]|uniref:hypothetical protein n=1 Tax=Sulfurimonas sp. TaxID=2022749 RepID=UPI0025E31F23|nr:hypothetical protein [Sulfurimonas sp.]MDD5158091.1 hypothetical protein [Sulfurimonas sp.]